MKVHSFRLWRTMVGLAVLFSLLAGTPGISGYASQPAAAALQVEPATAQPGGEMLVEGPFVDQPVYPTVFNGDLRDLPQLAPDAPEPVPLKYVPGQEPKGSAPQIAGWVDAVAQTEFGNGQMPAPIANFAGLDFNNFGAGWPPDTVGDVGPDHYIQAVNTSVGIEFDYSFCVHLLTNKNICASIRA